jgi:hypothetical protein
MKETTNYICGFFFALLLTNCTSNEFIYLRKDGTTELKTFTDPLYDYEEFYNFNRASFTSLRADSIWIEFTIANIDSLGKFFPPIYGSETFIFKYRSDTLEVMQGIFSNEEEALDPGSHSYIEILAERKIKHIITKNSYVKLDKRKNKVIIHRSRRSFRIPEKNLNLLVIFEK